MHFNGSQNNKFDYVTTFSNKGTHIWSIACNCNYLITNKRLLKQALTGLVLHRINSIC